MMRSFFIYLSGLRWMRDVMLRLGFTRRAVRRFVAGETSDDAIRAIRGLSEHGILATLDHLGESVETEAQARQAAGDYLAVLESLAQQGVRSHVSLKLTQFGLDVSHDLCRELVSSVIDKAGRMDSFVRLDMEGSPYTQRTIDMYRELRKSYSNVGIVIQAYLYRTEDDLKGLIAEGIANIRLCKGAYKEPPDIAFPKKADVDANMIKMMHLMLSDDARAHGSYLAMATHDPKMIDATKQCVAERGIGKDAWEFQMLYGIRHDLQQQLAAEGFKMRVYVPYGNEWYPYYMRRLAERPANVWFVFTNYFRP